MPPELPDLPRARTVLVLVDLINPLRFDGAEALSAAALRAATAVAALKADAARHGVPAVYVNDNFGRWQSDFRTLVLGSLEWMRRTLKCCVDPAWPAAAQT